MAWKVKRDEGRFIAARSGDMISSPFQCDFCWFLNLHNRNPTPHLYPSDERLLSYIRRVNLDIFWSRESSTVQNTLRLLKKGKTLSEELGLEPIRIPVGPWPIGDTCGFQVALETLRASQKPGRHVKSYTQFESVRKLRAGYINALDAGPARCLDNRVFKSDKGQLFSLISGATQSKLFMMFMKGCEKRMGRLVKQDLGISFEMLQEILKIYEDELLDENVPNKRKRFIVVCSGAFVILWAGALRGGEIFMLESSEFVRRRDDGRNKERDGHVIIPLMGRFKNETGERNLLMVLANITNGGLDIRKCVDRFTSILMIEGKGEKTGPAVCNENGDSMERWRLNNELHDVMEKVQALENDVVPLDIEVRERFNIHRSFRRGATTRAKEMSVPEATIELNNRWRKVQNKQGGLPNLPMSQLYIEISQALSSKLRFSRSL
jgi:hypothetical protein